MKRIQWAMTATVSGGADHKAMSAGGMDPEHGRTLGEIAAVANAALAVVMIRAGRRNGVRRSEEWARSAAGKLLG